MIKVVIFDLSKTTFKWNGHIQDGIEELVSFCKSKNLRIAFVTNNQYFALILKRSKLKYDCLVTPNLAGKRKPSPAFIDYIEKTLGISKDTFIYIGDSDKTDAFCAAHANVLYFCARWANPNAEYGIPIDSPTRVKNYLQKYLLKDNFWAWKLEKYDLLGRRLRALALLDCLSSIKDFAVDTFKWGHIKHKAFFLNHLIASIYLSGIYKEIDFWATYPPHVVGGSLNPVMEEYLKVVSKEFKDKYVDLFIRHKESVDSGASRKLGIPINFENQIGTVHLNSNFSHKLENKNVLVLDDFITQGYSSECARNILYKAGALDVICIGIGKYGKRYNQVVINSDFDPFSPINLKNMKFDESVFNVGFDPAATGWIETSFKGKP